jgi:hypothetical protein
MHINEIPIIPIGFPKIARALKPTNDNIFMVFQVLIRLLRYLQWRSQGNKCATIYDQLL